MLAYNVCVLLAQWIQHTAHHRNRIDDNRNTSSASIAKRNKCFFHINSHCPYIIIYMLRTCVFYVAIACVESISTQSHRQKRKKNEKKRNSEAKIGWTSSSECIAWGMRQWIRYFYSAISSLKSITDKALAHWMGPCQHQDVWNHSSAENEKKTQLWAAKEKLLLLSKSNNFRKHCDKYRIVSRMNDWILCTFYRVSSN